MKQDDSAHVSGRELGPDHQAELTHTGSHRQFVKLMLLVGAGMGGLIAIVLSDLTLAGRIRFLAYVAIAVIVMLLLARIIVYSYRRERARSNPYNSDHIIK